MKTSLNIDALHDEVWAGLEKVFASDQCDDLMREMTDNIKAAEDVNNAVFLSLRDRAVEMVRRSQLLLTTGGAIAVWTIEKHPLSKVPTPILLATFGAMLIMAITGLWALIAAIYADRSLDVSRLDPRAIVPFEQDAATTKSVAAYRMWLIPPRWLAVLQTETVLDAMGKSVKEVRLTFVVAFIAFVVTMILVAFCAGCYA